MSRQLAELLRLNKLPAGVGNTLDSWRLWVAILVVAVTGLFIWAIVNTQQIALAQERQARTEAIKTAQTHTQAQSAYEACLQSRPQIKRASLHVLGVNELASTLIENNAALLHSTQRTDPQYATRRANLARLQKAARKIAAVKSFPVPSLDECKARRNAILKNGPAKGT